MPQMRQDAVTKHWVIIATERARRPERPAMPFNEPVSVDYKEDCFFCRGNEATTPPEVYACRMDNSDPDTPGWFLRVVNNKFAAVNMEEPFQINDKDLLHVSAYATGRAEVLIETHYHSKGPSKQSILEIKRVLKAYMARYYELSFDEDLKYILIFRNHGAVAGASLEHPHSQIIAIAEVPPNVQEELTGSKAYYETHQRCVYCDMLQSEIKDNTRIVYENKHYVTLAPYASRVPFEMVIMPKFHSSSYASIDEYQLNSLADAWKETFYKLDAGLNNPPYNCYIHTAPTQQNVDDFYHWHIEILPKLSIAAGFEMGTGMYINVTIPEECAQFLRNVEVVF